MKAKSPSRFARCQHRTATGRQCCSLAVNRSTGLCPHHAAQTSPRAVDFREALTRQAAEFQNAQGVNHSLGALYDLLAEGSISPRRASVLAYISSLLLRTLPAIDYDQERYGPEAQAQTQSEPQPSPQPTRQPVPPGNEPLPKTAEEFAAAALIRKPN